MPYRLPQYFVKYFWNKQLHSGMEQDIKRLIYLS